LSSCVLLQRSYTSVSGGIMSKYEPAFIEKKWQDYWAENNSFIAKEDPNKPKYYVLCMFPYPSGSGLHVGHPLSYTAVDIIARYKRMNGFSVLNPMGWDAFGLPAERAAVREGRHPAEITKENIANFKNQLLKLGFSFDWDREVSTSSEDYYRWTQWIFLKLYEKGLAYLAEVPVNWCPAQGTVLANEEVVDGKYVETGDPVERRSMKQWMLKITAYAQRLLDDLDDLDWPEGVLEMQRQWIGRSEGATITFSIEGSEHSIEVYTTRPDTLFGATYCVIAPEHPIVESICSEQQSEKVASYVADAKNRSDRERQVSAEKEKTGVFTGAYAVNPVNGKEIPIWVADYVLISYGSGAIMAVPAHDERDHAFAKKFDLEIIPVISTPDNFSIQEKAWTGDGNAINSDKFNGLNVVDFKREVIDWLEQEGFGQRKVNFKLRDWLFSRQRYWGEPFPIVYTEDGQHHPVGTEDLPISLPHIEAYRPTKDGEPPLARAEQWRKTTFQGESALRETNTMPQWAGSWWYYLRYMDPNNKSEPFSATAVEYWQNVDLYIGGVEHAVLHLLYARFWHKVLFDCGLVPTKEPFQKLFNQGMILAYSYRDEKGKYYHPSEVENRASGTYVIGSDIKVESQVEKMSKSKKNTVDPLDIVGEFGADTLRMYEMFMGPLEQVKPWQTSGCKGIRNFLNKVWRLFVSDDGKLREFGQTSKDTVRALHVAIKETTHNIESLKFNTPVSRMMEFVNSCKNQTPSREDAEKFTCILSPYAPHLAEELWQKFGHNSGIGEVKWPIWDEQALRLESMHIVIQVRGKTRGSMEMPLDASKEEILLAAKSLPKIKDRLVGKQIIREIYVPKKLVNLVIK
jgi:leucyl-tRNA synthetase